MSTGTDFADMVRKAKRMNGRTRDHRDGESLKAVMIEDIFNSNRYPGYFTPERSALYSAAIGVAIAYDKHVNGYRIDGVLRFHIDSMSPWRFAGFLGEMIDAGITNCGEGEIFFQQYARTVRLAA